ncbi:DUF362 domain-containing protein, partial [Phenylobacterium sp.]|uniref:DUF362 domain-containing protein n=1 Tax=Phenylobacterium sp. TaxID=1871053 RepID=UPI0035AF611D
MHGLLAQARCSACADACPQDALQMTAEGLVLDPAACTGCGACVAACPQRAVALDGQGGIRPEPSAGGPEAAARSGRISLAGRARGGSGLRTGRGGIGRQASPSMDGSAATNLPTVRERRAAPR